MKLLTILIPCYNSEEYLATLLDSLLFGYEEYLDIIIVNDGSTDNTSKIAHQYEANHPSVISAIDSPNKGHGSAINIGIKNAKGLYFKVLDSDDYLAKDALIYLINNIKKNYETNSMTDVYLNDYVTLNVKTNETKIISINKKYIKEYDKLLDVSCFNKIGFYDSYIVHMFTLNTKFLLNINVKLLEHTFYEDNQFAIYIIKNFRNYIYLSKPLYYYRVNRVGQSVSLENVYKNYTHQLRVMKSIVDILPYEEYKDLNKVNKYHIKHALVIYNYLTYFYIYIKPNKEKTKAYKEYLSYFKNTNKKLYRIYKYHTICFYLHMIPPFLRGFITKLSYISVGKKKGWVF